MNPLVQAQIHQIEETLRDLSQTLDRAEGNAQASAEKYTELQKEVWSHRKEITALQRISDEFETISDENQRLHSLHAQLRDRLRSLLTQVKTLSGEFRP